MVVWRSGAEVLIKTDLQSNRGCRYECAPATASWESRTLRLRHGSTNNVVAELEVRLERSEGTVAWSIGS